MWPVVPLALALSLLYRPLRAPRSAGGTLWRGFTLFAVCLLLFALGAAAAGLDFGSGRPLMSDPTDGRAARVSASSASSTSLRFRGRHEGPPPARCNAILESVRRDAVAWASGGADALIVENFGDVPFRKGRGRPGDDRADDAGRRAGAAPRAGCRSGVNVLRNDVEGGGRHRRGAGGRFVRANVYAGAAVTDQGVIEGRAERCRR